MDIRAAHLDRRRIEPATGEAAPVFRFLADGIRRGQRGVLVTITALTGTGARSVGTQMAVLDNGQYVGSLSSGCVEAAIVAEAQDALAAEESRSVRFGKGSPYIDIRLPCGGGMDVLFTIDPPVSAMLDACEALAARRAVALRFGNDGSVEIAEADGPTGWKGDIFTVRHVPPLRLVMAGNGAEVLAALRLGQALGALVEIFSPEPEMVEAGHVAGLRSVELVSLTSPVAFGGDPWTAFLFLFHDHDWEPCLMASALDEPSFWIGAMGSRATHEARKATLLGAGVPADRIARIKGPIGLIPSSRDPATLALSALAEIVSSFREQQQ